MFACGENAAVPTAFRGHLGRRSKVRALGRPRDAVTKAATATCMAFTRLSSLTAERGQASSAPSGQAREVGAAPTGRGRGRNAVV